MNVLAVLPGVEGQILGVEFHVSYCLAAGSCGTAAAQTGVSVPHQLPLLPQPVRQQVGESGGCDPLCRCARQAMVETNIHHQVRPDVVGDRPEITGSITATKRLSEMP